MNSEHPKASQALIAGHLSFCRVLLRGNEQSKAHVGELLLQTMLHKLLFPATKRVVEVKLGTRTLASDIESNVLPICSVPASRVAAFELIIELSLHCLQNLERTIATLTHLQTTAFDKYVPFNSYRCAFC